MTDKQIEAAIKTLPNWREIPHKDWTVEQKTLEEELYCRGMINSCLCYGMMCAFYEESTGEWGRYAVDYRKTLSDNRIIELIAEQRADFEKATVLRNVGSDSEGVSYNSIKWADD